MAEKYESFDLSGTKIYVSEDHRFGTDAFLLADFADPAPHHKVCDLCTGCGIVPLIMCRNISKKPPKEIYGVEIMPEAVELFDKSVAENNLSDRIKPVLCDLKDPQGVPREYFDIVTVNPPYWKKGSGEERLSDAQAAARHEILCNIDDVMKTASSLLKFGGSLKLCQIPLRLADVICSMRSHGIEPKVMQNVVNRKGGKPWLVLISGKKGGKPGMELLPEIIYSRHSDRKSVGPVTQSGRNARQGRFYRRRGYKSNSEAAYPLLYKQAYGELPQVQR